MSTRTGRPHPESEGHVLCPFCDTACERASAVAFCLGCGRAFSAVGDEIVFDAERRLGRAELEAAVRADEARRAASTGLVDDARRRPVRLGKKGPPSRR